MLPWFDRFLDDAPLAAVGLLLLLGMLLAREIGGGLHRRLSNAADDGQGGTSDEGLIVSGVLGLLALLVAFTFSLALSRHEDRRELVVQEANAIGTAYMRSQLLDEPYRGELAGRLAAYAKVRLAFGEAAGAERDLLEERSEALQGSIWQATVRAVEPIRTTPLASLVASSVNSVVDLSAERKAALAARLPSPVLEALVLYAFGAAAIVGYALAGMRSRHRAASLLLFALLTLAILLILDLDRPRSGAILVPQEAMRDMVSSLPGMAAPAPPSR